VEINKS
jgi:hypothetical protein